MRCATHSDIETNLRCGKCSKPICPKCLVTTPVGARCRDCARLHRLPTYRLSFSYYLRAIGAALGMAIIMGVVWGFLRSYLGGLGPIISVVIGYGIGYAMAEVTGLAVNRKRGVWLAVVGSVAVVICFSITYLVDFFRFGFISFDVYRLVFVLVAIGLGVFISVSRLR